MLTLTQQPTDFWLDAYPLTHVFDTPELLASLAVNELSEKLSWDSAGELAGPIPAASESLLFLRIQAAASFYSSNRTLMQSPPLVDVDISLLYQWLLVGAWLTDTQYWIPSF